MCVCHFPLSDISPLTVAWASTVNVLVASLHIHHEIKTALDHATWARQARARPLAHVVTSTLCVFKRFGALTLLMLTGGVRAWYCC